MLNYEKRLDLCRHSKVLSSSSSSLRYLDLREESEKGGLLADRRGDVYAFTEDLELRINIALVTHRPLLIEGPPGCGKSSLARILARVMNWRYHEVVISSKTQAQDLLWKWDLLRRLYDANERHEKGSLPPWTQYLEPGPIWWAFNPSSALEQTVESIAGIRGTEEVPGTTDEGSYRETYPTWNAKKKHMLRNGGWSEEGIAPAVVLIDEIDKADPDVPNNLLQPIGSLQFAVDGRKEPIRCSAEQAPLIIITTNGERDLSDAFRRRCLYTRLEPLKLDELVSLSSVFFQSAGVPGDKSSVISALAAEIRRFDTEQNRETVISTAEFLDAACACIEWNLSAHNKDTLRILADATFRRTSRRNSR